MAYKFKVKNCCCCVTIAQGALIIGALHAFGLLIGLMSMNPIKIAFELFTGLTFLRMVYRDNEQSRLLFFTAFVVYVFCLGAIEIYYCFFPGDNEERQLVKDYCLSVEEALGTFDGSEFASLQDCMDKTEKTVLRDEIIIIAAQIIVQIHFILVLYTHYKNAHLPISKGGTKADLDITEM